MELDRIARLAGGGGGKVLLYVLDGLGGLPREPGGPTELEAARTPHLDELARAGTCGLHDPVAPGITPGSGPGHLALFGYDPLVYETGRGVLEALGIEFPLGPGDIAVRANFCTLDAQGRVADRRAGRIPCEEAAPLAARLNGIELDGARCTVRHVKEHRFVLVLHPDAPAGDAVNDTDPGMTGRPPHAPEARNAAAEPTARLLAAWLEAAAERLAGEPQANMALLRGVSSRPDWPRFPDVFGMRAAAAAAYPMYRGVARLVGMDACTVPAGAPPLVDALKARFADYDFFFLHFKPPDKAGEDGDFDRKVAAIEEADAIVPDLVDAGPDVVLVTGDHSTPSVMSSHSWHPVPFLLHGGPPRSDAATTFGETACRTGAHGRVRGCDLMRLATAAADRLTKFGA
ncbi:2,3-bisphosphoglycerate-independent phosphoglycerate mutase [Candidatus Palauibacter polyketidifaciens]|uniref:2,3-bisphosphoglycerate-independent phosphoglycerate mutase n=1 Tax=Candidatus Palauibacter polyketidifaciens TaxID=3056740 RepID=UPI002386CF12|nr:2,3-bisphosphoglycerate-independent phosphoglycerate mutase [Candidatus Palauibacter polyketidifaciens]MDE2719962.1 2,3-bisphosphoglycerate-independent phosphoglycerate mutase [Candidatus Palauibacter polyketidifaciens]